MIRAGDTPGMTVGLITAAGGAAVSVGVVSMDPTLLLVGIPAFLLASNTNFFSSSVSLLKACFGRKAAGFLGSKVSDLLVILPPFPLDLE